MESAAQFAGRVKQFKKKWPKVQSNCFFVPSEIADMTERGKLYLQEYDEALVILVKEHYYARVYYYMREKAQLPILEKTECPVILDTVFRGEEEKALEKCGISVWLENGFMPYKRYRRMECLKESFCAPEDQQEKLNEYPIVPLTAGDYSQVAELWESSLDIYSTLLPGQAEYTEYCDKGQVIGVRLKDGSAGAVIMVIPKGRTGFMQHLVVSPKLRGLGMGRTLFCQATEYLFMKCNADKVNFWVDEANAHAIKIYQKMGYNYDGIVSRQFLLGGR